MVKERVVSSNVKKFVSDASMIGVTNSLVIDKGDVIAPGLFNFGSKAEEVISMAHSYGLYMKKLGRNEIRFKEAKSRPTVKQDVHNYYKYASDLYSGRDNKTHVFNTKGDEIIK
jgi:hypothetical protein